MDAPAVVNNALAIDENFVNNALDGLADEELAKRPNDQTNLIGWLLWHATRVEDGIISDISNISNISGSGKPQAWTEGGWHTKFGLDADSGMGMGNWLEQVMTLPMTKANLQGYAPAVREKTKACLSTLAPADLDRTLPTPDGGTRTAGAFLGVLMLDHFHHSGQICYVRGYLTGKGWFPR